MGFETSALKEFPYPVSVRLKHHSKPEPPNHMELCSTNLQVGIYFNFKQDIKTSITFIDIPSLT